MSGKDKLRKTRTNTKINMTSKQQESLLGQSLEKLLVYLENEYSRYSFIHKKTLKNIEIIEEMKKAGYYNLFSERSDTYIGPDGGILFMEYNNQQYPILISEVKNQGTNDLRKKEGKSRQAQGNAIERLGKNVIGLKNYMINYDIFPFVCFGYGCDFQPGSSILDRVNTISGYTTMNNIHLYKYSGSDRCVGSFFFREEKWTVDDMFSIMKNIANESISYYEKISLNKEG